MNQESCIMGRNADPQVQYVFFKPLRETNSVKKLG
jgi:hypothetical protein